jgi:hypothetical protein
MKSKKDRKAVLDDIASLRSSIKEKNDTQRDTIRLQLVSVIDMLKKHILDKQNKLDKYIEKLKSLTNDEVALGLLDTINSELGDSGLKYQSLLKFEAEDKTQTSDAENLDVIIEICSRLSKIVLQLQKIEDILNIDFNN